MDGPRLPADVLDVASFRVNAFGAPTRILNALGDSRSIAYGDARFPLLPTRIESPNARIVGMAYEAAANLRFAHDSTHSSAQVATTEYRYDAAWNALRAALPPMGDRRPLRHRPR